MKKTLCHKEELVFCFLLISETNVRMKALEKKKKEWNSSLARLPEGSGFLTVKIGLNYIRNAGGDSLSRSLP